MRLSDAKAARFAIVTVASSPGPASPGEYRGLESERAMSIDFRAEHPLEAELPPGAALYRVGYVSNEPDAQLDEGPQFVFAVQVFPPEELVAPFREWLHGEHFDRQVTTPGLPWGCALESTSGELNFLNLWALEDPAVPSSEEYLRIRATPWFEQVGPIFTASRLEREVFEREVDDR